MKIYTKTGDHGETGLFDGTRVSKADPRVDAYGEVDELNAWLGLARAEGVDQELADMLERLDRYAKLVGLLFQVVDDILDARGLDRRLPQQQRAEDHEEYRCDLSSR